MTVANAVELEGLSAIGRIVADTLVAMSRALEPGITTGELDTIAGDLLEREGARSAPQLSYDFPGTTCISVNAAIAHGIPGRQRVRQGDLVNIDVSAEKDGFFADTGASFVIPPAPPHIHRLCRDGRRALGAGIAQVRAGAGLAGIGQAIGRFARRNGYTLIGNLASHGIGRALHEYPAEIPTWPVRGDRRTMPEGLVFTIEPFLSLGAHRAQDGPDPWTLYSHPTAPTVQYEHTVVATRSGAVILTLPSPGASG